MKNADNLTPAQRLAAELAAGVDPAQVLNTLKQALVADTVARDGSRQPDHRVRVEASKLLLAYAVGTPVQRQEIHTTITNTSEDDALRVLDSPAARAALKRMIDKKEKDKSSTPIVEAEGS